MTRWSLILGLLLALIADPVLASIVCHDTGAEPGIIAESEWNYLDSYGQVWRDEGLGVVFHMEEWDVPLPVDQIKFWSAVRFVTKQNEFYWFDDGSQEWVSLGYWPGNAAIEKEPESVPASPSIAPNPTDESTRISFQVYTQQVLSVVIFDVSGRRMRGLLDGSLPPARYELSWDGKDDQGHPVGSGVFTVRIESPEGSMTRRVVLAK